MARKKKKTGEERYIETLTKLSMYRFLMKSNIPLCIIGMLFDQVDKSMSGKIGDILEIRQYDNRVSYVTDILKKHGIYTLSIDKCPSVALEQILEIFDDYDCPDELADNISILIKNYLAL